MTASLSPITRQTLPTLRSSIRFAARNDDTGENSIDGKQTKPCAAATEADVVRRLRHADQRPRQLLWRVRAYPGRLRRAWRGCESVLGALGASQYRALLGDLPVVPRHLRIVARRNVRAFRGAWRQQENRILLRGVPEILPLRRCRQHAGPAVEALQARCRLQYRRRSPGGHATEAEFRPGLHGATRRGIQARWHAISLFDRQRRHRQRRDPALRAIAIYRSGRRQAAGADDCLDQPPRDRARSLRSTSGFYLPRHCVGW